MSPAPCPALVPSPWLLLAWASVLALPLAAWLVAAARVGPAKRARAGRAARALGPAALALAALVGAFRLLSSLSSATAAGPFAWLDLAGLTVAASPSPAGAPPACRGEAGDVLLALAALDGVLLVVLAGFFASRRGPLPRVPFRVPLADLAAALLGLAALAFLLGTREPYQILGRDAMLLDLAALVPVLCGALAVWTRSAEVPIEDPTPTREQASTDAGAVDVPNLWRRAGAIAPGATPLFTTGAAAGRGPGGVDASIWRYVDVLGDPPGALGVIGRALTAPFQGWLVGDLPDPTERLFLTALLFRAVQVEGVSCLIVTEDAKPDAQGVARSALRDSLDAAIHASGAWRGAPLVVGGPELLQAIAGRQMPAAAFLDVGELSSRGLRAFGRSATEEGAARWAASVGLVVVVRADRGTALAVTHRVFTLWRLGLCLRAAGARWSVVATGLGGEGTRALVERMFPGITVRAQPFEPRASAPVQAWVALDDFRRQPGRPWARRAVEPLIGAGLSASVADPLGSMDLHAVEHDAAKVQLARDVTLDGNASVGEIDDAWLLASFRTLANRVPLAGGAVHHALWSFGPTPVNRFLLRRDGLKQLAAQQRVPSPRPLAGAANRLLARAHLHAALREGTPDLESLRGMFGEGLVRDEIAPSDRYVVRAVPGGNGLVRVPLAAPPTKDPADLSHETITDRAATVVDRRGGRKLATVDWLIARTRYYPGRVFSVGSERYEVSLEAIDAERRVISVERVDATRALTRPRLSIELEEPVLVEPAINEKRGPLALRLASFDVIARETVSGVVHADQRLTEYAPVSAQYGTRIRAFSFTGAVPPDVLFHAARSLRGVLAAHLLAGPDEIDVIVITGSFHAEVGAGFAVVDRHVLGIGVAEALDAPTALEALSWVRAVLASCTCGDGCMECSPPEVPAPRRNKQGVLRLLGAL